MKTKLHRVATFPDTLDPFMCGENLSGVELLYVTDRGSTEEMWAKQFVPPKRFLKFKLHDNETPAATMEMDEIMGKSDLAAVLKKKGVEAFIIGPFVPSKYLHNWAGKNKIRILGPSYRMQKQLGNKIWFDKFLKDNRIPSPPSSVYNYSKFKALPFKGTTVLQKAESCMAKGTYFVENLEGVRKLRKEGAIRRSTNYLARKYIEGETFGIAVFVCNKHIVLSALRRQCFARQTESDTKAFIGIQWVPSTELSARAMRNIEQVFVQLGELLYKMHYFGFANFDFILDSNDDVHVIECNPRQSSASTQLMRFPELTSGVEVGKLYIEGFFKTRKYAANPAVYGFPETAYKGSMVYLSVEPKEPNTEVEQTYQPKAGVYQDKNGVVRFKGPDIRKLKGDKCELIVHSEGKLGDKYDARASIGRILSNFPMFTSSGRISRSGERLIERFSLTDGN